MITELHIETGRRGDQAFLKKAFFTPPLKVIDITENKRGDLLDLMLMSSSPGILDGDVYTMKIDLTAGTALKLQTQSNQRLFQMKKGAQQCMEVRMDTDSSFNYLPHPIVPHEAAIFSSHNKIYLSKGCSLVWGEVLSCGRKLCGEAFRYSSYHSSTEIYKNGRLVVKENLLMHPSSVDPKLMGQLEEYSHQATLLFLNESIALEDAITNIREWLSVQEGITYGASELHANGIIVRLLGHKARQLYDCLLQIVSRFLTSERISSTQLKPEMHGA
jgi:urease accessory protein